MPEHAGAVAIGSAAPASPVGAGAAAAGPVRPKRASVLAEFARHRLGLLGLALIIGLALFCFVGPLVYHTDQVHVNIQITNMAPRNGHPLGTDANGYDILGRLMVGGQSSLEIGVAVAILASIIGVTWGAIAGYAGGLLDAIMMRTVDVVLAIPAIFLLIYLSTVFRPTVVLLIVVVSLLSWLVPARLVRGDVLTLRTREFIDAVRGMGGGRRRIIFRHMVPNAFGTIVVSATFQVADAIILLATLSFLGFGLPPPAATWGGMLSQGTTYLLDGYWWEVYPAGVIIMLTVISLNFVGDALRDSLDARLRQ